MILAMVLAGCLTFTISPECGSTTTRGPVADLPPAEYDHPYSGTLHVIRLNIFQVVDVCRDTMGANGFSCARPMGTSCTIIIPSNTVVGDSLWRHEVAHCNGWPAHHPGARK
jgi:hypothetical protein